MATVTLKIAAERGFLGIYKSLCPWHNERTPSLLVRPFKGDFCCLSCGTSGVLTEDPEFPAKDMPKHKEFTLQREFS